MWWCPSYMKIVNTFYVAKVFVNLDEKPAFSLTELIVTNPTFRLLILEKVKIIICKVKENQDDPVKNVKLFLFNRILCKRYLTAEFEFHTKVAQC